MKIDRLTQDDGLPTLPVTHAMQDELGFVWLSTWYGLYRFDGYSYRDNRHDPSDSTSISSDWATSDLLLMPTGALARDEAIASTRGRQGLPVIP